jgi:NAD(P)-dependent dehydrogenase (short-subunit alcohol dehydrogenase family)
MPGAIVIGAGPGIGSSVAQRFAREGLPVCVLARSPLTVDTALAALDDIPAETLGLTVDVTDEAALRAALDEAVDRFGVPKILVYNAALIQSDVLGELTARQQLDAWAVNVVGAISAIAHLGPAVTEAGEGTILITAFDPDEIAEEYWKLHAERAGSWEREVLYSGRPAAAAAPRPD